MRYESVAVKESAGLDAAALSPANPREKWLRKRTQVKLRVGAHWSSTRGAWGCLGVGGCMDRSRCWLGHDSECWGWQGDACGGELLDVQPP